MYLSGKDFDSRARGSTPVVSQPRHSLTVWSWPTLLLRLGGPRGATTGCQRDSCYDDSIMSTAVASIFFPQQNSPFFHITNFFSISIFFHMTGAFFPYHELFFHICDFRSSPRDPTLLGAMWILETFPCPAPPPGPTPYPARPSSRPGSQWLFPDLHLLRTRSFFPSVCTYFP